MCHWHLIWWRMVIPWHQTWHGVTVWPNCRLVLWRVTPPTLLSWPSVPGWLPVKGQPCLPGRQPLPDRQPLLGHPPVTSRLLVELTLDFSDTWTICIAPLLDYVDRSVVKPLCVGVDRDTRWSVEPRLLWRLLWRSRMTRQVSTAGGLTPWQVRGCRLGRWTAIPALSTRLPWRPLLSHWIVATRVGRSCCPWRWILFLTWRWGRTSMFTAVVVGWTSPFRQVPRGTMVAGVTVLAPILIPGSSVMPISARLSPAHAIRPRRAYDLQLNCARTALCGWFVGLGFRLVVRWSVQFLTLLLLGSQGFFWSVDFNTIVHRFLQLFGCCGGFSLELLGLFCGRPNSQ